LKQFLAVNANARIAVGLGQIYLPSHGKFFEDKTQLLEPGINLNYAARILASEFQWTLKQAKPNWWLAVGRYHTPSNPLLAKAYREGVFKRCQKMSQTCTHYGAI
jgi:soluble lytic murein transglycosylase-like protein